MFIFHIWIELEIFSCVLFVFCFDEWFSNKISIFIRFADAIGDFFFFSIFSMIDHT
jgi:hypothetical protein